MTTEPTDKIAQHFAQSKNLLKSYRIQAGISLQDAANQTKLTVNFLKGLESENPLALNISPIYIRGYFYAYCKYLKIPLEEINQLAEQLQLTNTIKQEIMVNSTHQISKSSRIKQMLNSITTFINHKLAQPFLFWKRKNHE